MSPDFTGDIDWVDGPAGGTPLSAANMNAEELAIKAYVDGVAAGKAPLGTVPQNVRNLTAAPASVAGGDVLRCDATTGAFALPLPTPTAGIRVITKKIDASANAITLTGTVDGVVNPTLTTQWQSIELEGNGSSWDRVVRPVVAALADYPAVTDARYVQIGAGAAVFGSSVVTKTAAYTVTAADVQAGKVILADATATGPFTLTLPTAVGLAGSIVLDAITAALSPPVQAALATSTTGGTGLAAATTYYYVVTALSSTGETTRSNEQSILTGAGTTNSNTVSWAAVPGATGYRIYRGTSATVEGTYYAVGLVTTFVDTGAAGTAASPTNVNTTGTSQVTLATTASQTIEGQTTVKFGPQGSGAPYRSGILIPDGANWRLI